MNQTDPIGDMLARIRNGCLARLESVAMPASRCKDALARLLKREGFIRDFTIEGGPTRRTMRIYLKYDAQRAPVIRGLRRVSKPGRRRYISYRELRPVMSGTGEALLSTSRGWLSGREVRRYRVGGEWVCTVW